MHLSSSIIGASSLVVEDIYEEAPLVLNTIQPMVLEDDCTSMLVVPSILISAMCATQNLTIPTIFFFFTGVLGMAGACCVTTMKEMEKGNVCFFSHSRAKPKTAKMKRSNNKND